MRIFTYRNSIQNPLLAPAGSCAKYRYALTHTEAQHLALESPYQLTYVYIMFGQAMLESIPVIYAELAAIDRYDSELAGLKAPFGAMRMALDVITGSYHGHRELRNMPLSDFAATNLVTQCESDGIGDGWDEFDFPEFDLPWEDAPCDSISGCETCYYDIDCYPSYHIGV